MGAICENKACGMPLSVALLNECGVKWNQTNGQVGFHTQFGPHMIGTMCPEVSV